MSSRKSRRQRPLKRKSNKRKIILAVVLLAVVAVITVVAIMIGNTAPEQAEPETPELEQSMKVLLTTNMGDIVIELRDDMPITTSNFKNLVKQGVYDDTIFHRVIDGFMIQGGDPTGTGYGDPSIPTIKDEFTDNNRNDRGTVAMANTGYPDTGSSQFFINLVDNNYLDDLHPVFGKVIKGMDVVDQIAKVAVDEENNYRPLEEVRIIKAQLVD